MYHRRRSNNLRPVHSIKHVIDQQNSTIVGSSIGLSVIQAKDLPTLAQEQEVQTGSRINSIFLNVQAVPTSSGALSNFYLIVWKDPGGNLSQPTPNTVGANDNKKFVIHQEMVMLERQTNGNPRVVFKGVISIPKIYRRFGPNDELTVTVLTPGITADYCTQCIYKEYR